MKNAAVISKILILSLVMVQPILGLAQIGIGTTSPHPSSMLHINPGAGNNKGILLPQITSASRVVLDSNQNIAHGLIFFDSDLQKHYYFHENPKMWFELDHDWIRKDVAGASPIVGTHIYSGVPGNVGIGTAATVNPASKLTVVGNQSIGSAAFTQDSVPPANSLIVQTWVGIGTSTRIGSRRLDVKGSAGVTGTLTVTSSVTAAQFIGEGVVPAGGIMMYSGTTGATRFDASGLGVTGTAYEGWALCNGLNGTPDLRGRFVAGQGNALAAGTNTESAIYPNQGFGGGERTVTLTDAEMPSHTHNEGTLSTSSAGSHNHATTFLYGDGAGSSNQSLAGQLNNIGSTTRTTDSDGAHTHPINGLTGAAGGGAAHENRPPFYVLAFIKKL